MVVNDDLFSTDFDSFFTPDLITINTLMGKLMKKISFTNYIKAEEYFVALKLRKIYLNYWSN